MQGPDRAGYGLRRVRVVEADVSHDEIVPSAFVGHSICLVDSRLENARGAAQRLRLEPWMAWIVIEPLKGSIYLSLNSHGRAAYARTNRSVSSIGTRC